MDYIKIAQTGELKDGEKKVVTIKDKVLLITNVQDSYYAINNKCPHMGGSLFDGKLDGHTITCPKHGSVFDVRTGKVVKNGKIVFINLKVDDSLAYPIKIEGNDVLIGIE